MLEVRPDELSHGQRKQLQRTFWVSPQLWSDVVRNALAHECYLRRFTREYIYIYIDIFFFAHFYFPASGQAVVTGVIPFPPRFLPSIFIAHRVQQSHCSSIFHRVLLTHALALSASQFVRKKKSPRIYTSMHPGGIRTHETDLYQTYKVPGISSNGGMYKFLCLYRNNIIGFPHKRKQRDFWALAATF